MLCFHLISSYSHTCSGFLGFVDALFNPPGFAPIFPVLICTLLTCFNLLFNSADGFQLL